jgi:folate-binding Fe-S cluster repair protein YgfZ
MLNLHRLGGVDFNKGCYPGQEIVARVQYLGQVKRSMFLVEIAGPAPEPGFLLVAGAEEASASVVHAALHPDGGCRALVVASADSPETASGLLGTGNQSLRVLPLPYP